MKQDNELIVQQIQAGEGDREKLLERLWTENIRLIRKIIYKLTGLDRNKWSDRQDFEDLEQQAFIGIMEAIANYDRSRDVKFFSFAQAYIRKSIYRYYDRSGQTLRIPVYMRKRIRQYLAEKERLGGSVGTAADGLIQERLGWSDNALRETLLTIQKMDMQRLDSYLNEGDKKSTTLLELLSGEEDTSKTAISGTYNADLHNLLFAAMRCLTETERRIIICRHFQGMNDSQIAKVMECTRQNVGQHRISAYKKMRMGKYGKELATFLPERSGLRAEKRIRYEFEELSQEERNLML